VLRNLVVLAVLAQTLPTPQPFPKPGAGQAAKPEAPPQPPAAAPAIQQPGAQPPAVQQPPPSQGEATPTEAVLGAPIYPGAQFLSSYDAGRGQRFYIFGSTASFLDLVAYYRNVLKQKGDLVFDAPATHEFDIGRFREETMAFPPSVTVKEYKSELSEGYPNPKAGGQPARFPTIIQFVPPPAGTASR
jgi:hypothetical protein